MNNNNKPKPTELIESPESLYYKSVIERLQNNIKTAQDNIKQSLWSISALKQAQKTALKKANKK